MSLEIHELVLKLMHVKNISPDLLSFAASRAHSDDRVLALMRILANADSVFSDEAFKAIQALKERKDDA